MAGDRARPQVEALAAALRETAARVLAGGLDELVVVTWTYDLAARMRSYELIAGAMRLDAAARPGTTTGVTT